MALYALVARRTCYYLVGPFPDRTSLLTWGEAEGLPDHWSEVELSYADQMLPRLRGPDYHPPRDDIPSPPPTGGPRYEAVSEALRLATKETEHLRRGPERQKSRRSEP